jgi:hypothetical protein
MDADTINPQSLLFQPMNSEVPDATTNVSGTDFGPLDSGNISFDNVDLDTVKPGLTEPDVVDFGTWGSGTMDAGLTLTDPTYSGSASDKDLDLNEIATAPSGSGMLGLNAAGFGISGPTRSSTTLFHSMNPGMTTNQGTEYEKRDIDVLEENIADDTMTYRDMTGANNLNVNVIGIGIAGDQQTYSWNRMLPLSAAGQCPGVAEVRYTHTHPILPKQIGPGGSAERQRITLANWIEYRPKCHDAFATRVKITGNDWEEYRPFVEQLYIVENVKLEDVMRILETRFDFVATYVGFVYFSSFLSP